MNIVLLEGLGVSEKIILKHKEKLESMNHQFKVVEKNLDPKIQVEQCKDADIIMLANMPLSELVINEAKNLKYINVAFTGVDHIPLAQAKEKEILVSNASGYATDAVAELCIGFMIQLLRRVDLTQIRAREGKTKDGLVGNLLANKTIGIVGAGAIGKRTAQLAKVFNTKVIAYNRSKIDDPSIDEQVSLEQLLQEADIVSLHTPLTNETKNLIGKKELDLMKKSAFLINTARGGVVDSQALADALNNDKIAGAAIDVFEMEPPLVFDHPLLHSKNTIVTPHIAFASQESMELRAKIVFDNLYAFLDGKHTNKV